MFTNADNFGVTFGPRLPAGIRPVCLGATFLIDFEHFEKSGNS